MVFTPAHWVALLAVVLFHWATYPRKNQQFNDMMDYLFYHKRVKAFQLTLLYWYDVIYAVIISFAAVGYFFYLMDAGYSVIQPSNYQVVLALHFVSIIIWTLSFFQFTYWFANRRYRIISLIIVGLGALAAEIVAFVFLCIECFSNANTDVLVPGTVSSSVTIGLVIAASIAWMVFLIVTLIVFAVTIKVRMSNYIRESYRYYAFSQKTRIDYVREKWETSKSERRESTTDRG